MVTKFKVKASQTKIQTNKNLIKVIIVTIYRMNIKSMKLIYKQIQLIQMVLKKTNQL